MPRGDRVEEDVPALDVGPSLGHYSTGFSAIIKDGKPVEPVSTLGPIGFLTHRLTVSAWRRYRRQQKVRNRG